MVRIVTGTYTATPPTELTATQKRKATAVLGRRAARNPLRRIRLECETRSQRDTSAVTGDRLWCDGHADFARVVSVVE
jgi:hypothetical protein